MYKKLGAIFALFFLIATGVSVGQDSAQSSAATKTSAPDQAGAYYHFMLARRYEELAGLYNRSDLVDRAIAEYQKAMADDPDSLFLRNQLAALYWRVSRVGDAVREAQAILKIDPNNLDAHHLLGGIYLHDLGDTQHANLAQKSLKGAIEQYEAIVRLSPKDIDSMVILGRLYALDQQPAKAEEILKQALNTSPDSKSALTYLAKLYMDREEYPEAIASLKKIPAGQVDAETLSLLGQAYSQVQDYASATKVYREALDQEPESRQIHRAYAESLMRSGKIDEARKEFEEVLKLNPQDSATLLRLGQLDQAQGHFDAARQELERARGLEPDDPEITYQMALLEDAVGNQDKAIEILQGLLDHNRNPAGHYTQAEAGNRATVLERLGLIYRSQEKFDLAFKAFQEIMALGESQAPRGEGLMIETLRLDHQVDKAFEEATQAHAKYPHDRSITLLWASLLGERGQVDQGVAELQNLLKGSGDQAEVELSIAQIYSQAKRYPEAQATIEKLLAQDPPSGNREFSQFLLGSVYERQKKYDLAETEFKKILARDPLNAAAANYLGYILADRGIRLDESVKYIQQALRIEPNNGAYLDSLGWAYYKMNRYDLAQAPLEKAARLLSNDPTVLEHLGKLYMGLGMKKQAAEAWEHALKEWPNAVDSDFDAQQASKLGKQLEQLKKQLPRSP